MNLSSSDDRSRQEAARRLRRLSSVMRAAIIIGALLGVLGFVWMWSSPDRVLDQLAYQAGGEPSPVTGAGLAVMGGILVSALPLALLASALWEGYCLLGACAGGIKFSARAAKRVRHIGLMLFIMGLLRAPTRTLTAVALTWGNPAGQKILSLQFSSDDYFISLAGGMLLVIGYLLVEATRIADENSQFV